MRVLIACEMSGRVRDAFAALGHDAWSCDILPTESPGNHYQGDVLDYLNEGWDLMVAHPPCTYLSNAGARHLYPKSVLNPQRLALGMEGKEFFMSLWEAPIEKICVENPMPSKVFGLPAHTQMIQPWYFGDPYTKKTLLWLKNLNRLMPTNIVEENIVPYLPSGTGRKLGKKTLGVSKRDSKSRSYTFEGIANAMAAQWG